jgi:1-acyl-sn-glycerol-3-phosphate acyltransferase
MTEPERSEGFKQTGSRDNRPADAGGKDSRSATPRISRGFLRLFSGYSRWYLRRHFHAVRLLRGTSPAVEDARPLVVYLHHASWWDPLVGLLLAREWFPHRTLYAPIDAQALRQYRFFARLGFFGVELGTVRGAASFLRQSLAVLQQPGASLWVTPQGRFADVRERPVRFRPGLGHLARRLEGAIFLPVAIEYVFWEERTPEVLIGLGSPIVVEPGSGARWDAEGWTARLEEGLAVILDEVAEAAQRRQASDWSAILEGRSGVGMVYDGWRSVRAWLRDEAFHRRHGRG